MNATIRTGGDDPGRARAARRKLAHRCCVAWALAVPIAVLAADLSTDFNALVAKGSARLPAEAGSTRITRMEVGDFDCDDVDDLALGDPASNVTGASGVDHGSVTIGFGDRSAALRAPGQRWNQSSPGVAGAAEPEDRFGASLAAADFDDDDCSDLAIGVPGEDYGSPEATDAGAAAVLFGSPGGLDAGNDLFLPEAGETGVHGVNSNHFKGTALVAIDRFTSISSRPYLAIGAPGHSPGAILGAGAVSVRRSNTGILDIRTAFVERGVASGSSPRFSDSFGRTLDSGDFDNDSFGDLVIGAHAAVGATIPCGSLCVNGEGAVIIAYGASSSDSISGELINQDTPGVAGTPEAFDEFGDTVAVGDFNGDDRDDLAVAAPSEDIGTIEDAGSVTVLYGDTARLVANAGNSDTFDQSNLAGVNAEALDLFGRALAAGDFNRDGFDDLAIGAPGENLGGSDNTGLVTILYGTASGLDAASVRHFSLDTPGMVGDPAGLSDFGRALAAGDFNDDSVDDLAVAVPAAFDRGAVSFIFSSADTVTSIASIAPSPATVGQPYTVNVSCSRVATGGLPLCRGSVTVTESGGGACTASIAANGQGSCQITPTTAGIKSVTANHLAVIGYRASTSTPRTLVVNPLADAIFANGYE